MKYIDVEKLYKQIDELMAHFAELEKEAKPDDSIYYQGKIKMCSELLAIIDSLQQEQSEGNLEKEIQRYLCEECSSDDEPTIAEIARHFYELGRTEGIKGNLEEIPSNVDFNGKKTNKR